MSLCSVLWSMIVTSHVGPQSKSTKRHLQQRPLPTTNESTSPSHHKGNTADHVVQLKHQNGDVDLMEENRMSLIHSLHPLPRSSFSFISSLSSLRFAVRFPFLHSLSLCNACGLHYAKIIKREVLVPARKSETTAEAMNLRTLLN